MISFFVAGLPKTAGSKRGFYIAKIKRVVITDANKNSKDWKIDVRNGAAASYSGPPLLGPLSVSFTFFLPRPKAHFKKDAVTLSDAAPPYPDKKPDVLKLARAVEDACTSIVWKDDAQIVLETLAKLYTNGTPGVSVRIEQID